MNAKNPPHNPDTVLAIALAALLVLGLIMLYSASFYVSLTYQLFQNDPSYVFRRQLLWAGLGVIALLVLAGIDYHRWQRLSVYFLTTVVVLLIVVLAIPDPTGTRSWIRLGPGSVQPSEFAKLALVLYMAAWLPQKAEKIRNALHGTIPFALIVALVAGLVILQPDFGTALVLVGMAAAVFFIAGADLLQMALGAAISAPILMLILQTMPEKMARFACWQDPFKCPDLASTYQMRQALIALGSGGISGMGLGASRQKFLWLPLAHSDAIFAVIGEELGLIGAVLVIGLYAVFIYRGFRIALAAPDRFGMLLAAGVTCWITIQTLVNLGGITASMPFTGVPLPFISSGGSSLVACLAGVGLLLSVSRQTIAEKKAERASLANGWWHRWARLPGLVGR